jgi:CHAT domain-containing protein
VEVKRYLFITVAATVAALFVFPATGWRSTALALNSEYVKYQLLTAKYYQELRFDEARVAAHLAYQQAHDSLTPERVTRPLASLCAIEMATFHYREAARLCLSAEEQAGKFGDRDMAALGAFHLSNLYFHLDAIGEAEAAMERVRAAGPVDRETLPRKDILHQEARLAARLHSPAAAMKLFVEAANAASTHDDSSALAQIWDAAALEFFLVGNWSEAERLATESFRLRRLLNPADLSSSFLFFSKLRLKQGRPREALHFAEQAFSARAEARQPVFSFYFDRGGSRYALGDRSGALTDLAEAAEDVRSLRLTMAPADALRRGSAGRHQEVFQALSNVYADLYLETGRHDYAERGLAAAAEGRAYAFRESSGELSRIRQRLTQEYFTTLQKHRQIEEALFVHITPERRKELSRLRLRLTELELAAGLDAPSAAGPDWRLKGKPGQALLHFSLGPDRSLLWTVTSSRVQLSVLPSAAVINETARMFRQGVESETRAAQAGRKLHRLLFANLPANVRRMHNWRIVADGELSQIPFAALEDAHGRYLLEDHSLLMVPHAFEDNSTNQPAFWDGPAVAFGDPVYNPADGRQPSRQWTLNSQAPWLPRLPGTAREIRACSRLWGAEPKIFLGADVDLERIQASLQNEPRLLHFAMHMVPGSNNPSETRLALAVESDGKPRFLDPATIASMKIRSALVVLSGCRAGSGTSVPGEGIAGLGRAWLLAGAGSVAATLWPIDDDSGELFQVFYRALGPESPEEALRQAQLAMLHSGTWRAQPRYWGAYFLIGRA